MKFEEAFDTVFEIEKKRSAASGKAFAVTPATAKTLAYFWNMLAVADSELDDIVYLGKNNEIISQEIPGKDPKVKKEKVKKEKKSNKGQKSLSDKTAETTVDNGKEEKEKAEATTTTE